MYEKVVGGELIEMGFVGFDVSHGGPVSFVYFHVSRTDCIFECIF